MICLVNAGSERLNEQSTFGISAAKTGFGRVEKAGSN